MQIDFFEEFPSEENLAKSNLLTTSSLVYLAAHSLDEFDEVAQKLKSFNPHLRVGYWPILKESYWISPFSHTYELRELKNELLKRDAELEVLLDLELPILNPNLFFKNLFSFLKNKLLIQEIFSLAKTSNIRFSTAEYSLSIGWTRFVLSMVGVSYSIKQFGHQRIIMFYSSMRGNVFRSYLKTYLKNEVKNDPSISLGLGTTGIGVFGNEPVSHLKI